MPKSGMRASREALPASAKRTSSTNRIRSLTFFFFQAEDGIRDLIVTGVQTCALPISKPRSLKQASEILAAALACFKERGFATTRLEDVAAKAGVTKGTIYLYYPSKEDRKSVV